MNKHYLIILMIINIGYSIESGGCGTIADADNIRESSINFRNYLQTQNLNLREIHWIPVQFHIVQHDNGTGGLNEIILPGIIDDLNADYINANIRFYQYSLVDYILDSDYYTTDGDVEINQLKSINNTTNVIDIYAVGSLSSGDNALCGISSFTWFGIQGIIVANGCFDRSTVNHEMGHYFNLFHPHETADGTEYVNGNGCQYRGDGICDTPADPNLSLGGMVSGCNYTGNATDPIGQEYDDCQGYAPCEFYGGPDIGNIMSYSPDACVDHFTDEQYEKAEYVLTTIREDYIQPPNFVDFTIINQMISDNDGDGDFVINPGETIDLVFEIEVNEEWPAGATDIILTLSSDEENIDIEIDQIYTNELNPGESYLNQDSPFRISFSTNSVLKEYNFNLNLSYLSDNNDTYIVDFTIILDVSLNQFGFPFQTESTVESSPAIIDIDNDGTNEIIFGDYSGKLNICEYDMQNCSQYITDGQIWSSPAIADIDNDGEIEIVIASVDKYIYILNSQGELEYSYFTDQFLVGTPAIGNLDLDPELEIVIGGYATSGMLFAINHNGTALQNYPLAINEKMKKGVALADVNSDGIDEIFFGTESDNLYRIDTNGTIYNNSPLLTVGDKIKFAPIIVSMNNEFHIIVGSTDGNLYVVNPDGELEFYYETGDEIHGAAIVPINNSYGIVFGSEDGFLYLVDNNGNNMSGWPQYTGISYESAPVIADLDLDGSPEITVSASTHLQFFSINSNIFIPQLNVGQTVKGNPAIADLDLDGDLEAFTGTNFNLSAIDIKTNGSVDNYWSVYRGNLTRTGFIEFEELNIVENSMPLQFKILKPYPNPFNANLTLPIQIDITGYYIFKIFNIQGQMVKTSDFYFNQLGVNSVNFDFNSMASGTYFISCKNDIKVSEIVPIILLK